MARNFCRKSLLIGNGVNLINTSNHFSNADIASRFRSTIGETKDVFNVIFLDKLGLTQENLYDYCKCNSSDNIEQILGKIYKFLVHALNYEINNEPINIKQRITDFLFQVGLKAIFIQNNELVAASVPRNMSRRFGEYQTIATLNYYEDWDTDNRCFYLHGRFDFVKYRNSMLSSTSAKPIMFFSGLRYGVLPEYKIIVDRLAEANSLISFDEGQRLIMLPDCLSKDSLETDFYPSERLLPANDLILPPDTALYQFFNNVEKVDVFGVSPYGDDSLINKLINVAKVTIYVYGLKDVEGQKAEEIWKDKIPHAKIRDSKLFLNAWF